VGTRAIAGHVGLPLIPRPAGPRGSYGVVQANRVAKP
jgi:hypothetical protein